MKPRVFNAAWRHVGGASAVEFAILAPVLLGFIFLIIEGSRLLWTEQAIQEVAANAARCMAIGTAPCKTSAEVQAFAQSRGADRGVTLTLQTIATASNQTCNGATGMSKVTITLPYTSPIKGLLPGAPSTLQAVACYPAIT